MAHNGVALDDSYEEDFMEFPEDEEDEIPVKRTIAVRPSQNALRRNPNFNGAGKISKTIMSDNGDGSSNLRANPGRPVVKNGNSTGLMSRTGLGKSSMTGLNRSLRLPQIRPPRNDLSRRPTDNVSERVLSARANRVHDLENERNVLRAQVQDMKREIQTLNQILRRHSKALGQYEGGDDRLPTLLQKSEEDGRITREHLRQSRQKYGLLREHYRQLEQYSQTVEKERAKLEVMVKDRGLQDNKKLKEERDLLLQQLDDSREREKELERRITGLQKTQQRERQYSEGRVKETTDQLERIDLENAALKDQLKSSLSYKENTRNGPQSRSRLPVAATSSASSSKKSPVRGKILAVRLDDDKHLLQNAKSSFIQEFNAITSVTASSGSGNPDSKEEKVKLVEGTNKNPPTSWKPRTSPDLLRDHEERIVFSDLPSSSSSKASSISVLEKARKQSMPNSVGLNEWNPNPDRKISVELAFPEEIPSSSVVILPAKSENVLKNELLDKIRLLDVKRNDSSVSKEHELFIEKDVLPKPTEPFPFRDLSPNSHRIPLDGPLSVSQKPMEILHNSKAPGRFVGRVESDDEIEEIEFF